MTKCRQRAKDSVWWPGIRKDIDEVVSKCERCCKIRVQHPEPLIPTPLPGRPWQKVGTDLFEWKKNDYLLVVDYYSKFIEVAKLSSTTATHVISHLKSIFARHGIPATVMSDNGPQYSATAFQTFAKEYEFEHVTSSPKYPQANGMAERAVKQERRSVSSNDGLQIHTIGKWLQSVRVTDGAENTDDSSDCGRPTEAEDAKREQVEKERRENTRANEEKL